MRPINYFNFSHTVRLAQADDGFGNLVEVPFDAFWFNDEERKAIQIANFNEDQYV